MTPGAMTATQWCQAILSNLSARGPDAGILDIESSALVFALPGSVGDGLYMVSIGYDAQLEFSTTTKVLADDLDMGEDLASPVSYARQMVENPSYLTLTTGELDQLRIAAVES